MQNNFINTEQTQVQEQLYRIKIQSVEQYNALLAKIQIDEEELFQDLIIIENQQTKLIINNSKQATNLLIAKPEIKEKLKRFDLNFLYYMNELMEDGEEDIVNTILTPLIQKKLTLITPTIISQQPQLQETIIGEELNFLYDLKNIMQTKTQIEILKIQQEEEQEHDETIIKNFNQQLTDISDYLLRATLQNNDLQVLIVQNNINIIQQLRKIFFVAGRCGEYFEQYSEEQKNESYRVAFIKNIIYSFPESQDRLIATVLQDLSLFEKIANVDLDAINMLLTTFPKSINNIQYIIFQNQENLQRIFNADFSFIKTIKTIFPTLENKMQEIVFKNQQNINKIFDCDVSFIETMITNFQESKWPMAEIFLKNEKMKTALEELDFYFLHQFPKFFLNSFKNQLLGSLLDNQIIKLSLVNLNEKNLNILINFQDELYKLFDLIKEDKEFISKTFLEEIINNNDFHEQFLQLNINSINKLRPLIYLEGEILEEYLNIMFFENEDFYQHFSIPYLNIIQKLFIDKTNINNRNYYLGSKIANNIAYTLLSNREETVSSNQLIIQQISRVNIDLIYNLSNFFESMLSRTDRMSIEQTFYYFQYECISQLCKSEVFIDRMSKEPDFILQLNFIFNRDNGYLLNCNTLDNYRCYMQKTITQILMKNIATQNTVIQNILSKTFLDNLEMFLIHISRKSSDTIKNCKGSFLIYNSEFISKAIKESPLTDELIDFINNLKVFSMENGIETYVSNLVDNKFLGQLKEEDQEKMKNDLIIKQKYLISNTQKTFIQLYTNQLYNLKLSTRKLLYLNMVASEEATNIELYKNAILIDQISELDKQIEPLNHLEASNLLKIRKIFQMRQNIQEEEIVLQNMQNKSLEEQEEILVQREQEVIKQQQENEQLYNLMGTMVGKNETRQITKDQEQLIQRILANAPRTFSKQPDLTAIVDQIKQAQPKKPPVKEVEQQQKAIVEQQVLAQKASVKQVVVQRRGRIPVVQKPIVQQTTQQAPVQQPTVKIVQQTTQQAPVQQPTVKRVIAQDARLLVILLEKQQVQQKLAQQKRDLEAAIQQRKQEFMDQRKQREQILAQKTRQEKMQDITAHSKSPKCFIEAQNSLLSTKNKFEQFKKDLELRQMKMPGKK